MRSTTFYAALSYGIACSVFAWITRLLPAPERGVILMHLAIVLAGAWFVATTRPADAPRRKPWDE